VASRVGCPHRADSHQCAVESARFGWWMQVTWTTETVIQAEQKAVHVHATASANPLICECCLWPQQGWLRGPHRSLVAAGG
jgi:hypothetical protein